MKTLFFTLQTMKRTIIEKLKTVKLFKNKEVIRKLSIMTNSLDSVR